MPDFHAALLDDAYHAMPLEPLPRSSDAWLPMPGHYEFSCCALRSARRVFSSRRADAPMRVARMLRKRCGAACVASAQRGDLPMLPCHAPAKR
jgi:hypothetical protein